MKQVSSLQSKKMSGKEMKQIKGGGPLVRGKWWICPTNIIECGAPQADCNANCPGAVCKLVTACP